MMSSEGGTIVFGKLPDLGPDETYHFQDVITGHWSLLSPEISVKTGEETFTHRFNSSEDTRRNVAIFDTGM